MFTFSVIFLWKGRKYAVAVTHTADYETAIEKGIEQVKKEGRHFTSVEAVKIITSADTTLVGRD